MFKIPLKDAAELGWWAWEHRHKLPSIPKDPGEFVEAVVHKGQAVARIGSTLIFGDAETAPPLAFIGQSAGQLPDIERAISGVVSGQQLLAGSLASLQSISMVTLGLTAVTPLILAAQFNYLRKRFNALEKDIRNLERLVEDRYVAELESGLELLESGVRQSKKARLESSLEKCNDAAVFFSNRLQNAVKEDQDRRGIQLLSRHLAVAICGTTRCYVALEEDAEARKALRNRCKGLREASRAIFQKTVGKNPERFLVPELSKDVSLNQLVALFQQAKFAGALDKEDDFQRAIAEGASASDLFETLREPLFKPKWSWGKPNVRVLLEELRDATACVEETNRVLSLGEVLDQAKISETPAIDTINWFDEEAKEGEDPFFAWGF